MFGVQLQAQELLPGWGFWLEVVAFLGVSHTHFPLRTCHSSAVLLGRGVANPPLFVGPEEPPPLLRESPHFSCFFLSALRGTIFPPCPQHNLLKELTFSENKPKPPLRQGLSSQGLGSRVRIKHPLMS